MYTRRAGSVFPWQLILGLLLLFILLLLLFQSCRQGGIFGNVLTEEVTLLPLGSAERSQYVATGVGTTQTYTINPPTDQVLIVGGYIVNDRAGGVYVAYAGGRQVTVTITDGFAVIVPQESAREEFCFRVRQAQSRGWAAGTIEPLPGWAAC